MLQQINEEIKKLKHIIKDYKKCKQMDEEIGN